MLQTIQGTKKLNSSLLPHVKELDSSVLTPILRNNRLAVSLEKKICRKQGKKIREVFIFGARVL